MYSICLALMHACLLAEAAEQLAIPLAEHLENKVSWSVELICIAVYASMVSVIVTWYQVYVLKWKIPILWACGCLWRVSASVPKATFERQKLQTVDMTAFTLNTLDQKKKVGKVDFKS